MLPYAIIFFSSAFLSMAIDWRGPRSAILFRTMFVFLAAFAAFRFEVGCDWFGYYFNYIGSQRSSLVDSILVADPAWWIWLWLIHLFDLPYPVANLLPTAVFFAGLWHLARRQPNPSMILVLTFSVLILGLAMSGIRQAAAFGILCFAVTAFLSGRTVKFSILVLLAGLWHSSALVFFLFLPLSLTKDRRLAVLWVALLSLPILVVLLQTDSADVAMDRYATGASAIAYGAPLRLGLLAGTAIFYFMFLRGPWSKRFPKESMFVSIMALAMLGSLVLIPFSSIIADRLGYYLILPQLIILGRIPVLLSGKLRLLGLIVAYGQFVAYFAIWAGFSDLFQQCYVPYQTWILGFPGPMELP